MLEKIIRFIAILYFIASVVCGTVLYNRLVKARQLVEHYRVELECAKDRESDIAESIRRTGEILDSSITTVSGLRAQIAEIRKNYEEMESRLYNIRGNDYNDDDLTNYTNEKLEENK